jgi:hypothetical protein
MQNFDEISGFLRIDPVMLTVLIILSSRTSRCTSVLKIQGLPMLRILLVMEEEYKVFFILAILQFPCSESLYLACKTF